jgi:hypothetical protein
VKRLIGLLLLCLIVFVVVYRQRIFLRDPLATVTRDGVKMGGVQVMINYTNDVLLTDASKPERRLYLIQSWNKVAEVPSVPLKCIYGVACMTDSDQASAAKLDVGSRGRRPPFEGVTMTNRRVRFVDEDGALVEVVLR